MRKNPALPIANIFVLTVDIGGQGRRKEREGQGERIQGSDVGGEGRNRGKGTERGRLEKAARRNRDGAEDHRKQAYDGRGGARATGS